MSLKINFSVGLLTSVWSALLTLAVVPLYLHYLGKEAYGLIGFFATTQALLQLLDLGISPTANREVARFSTVGNMQAARNFLHTISVVYWGMAGVIALFMLGLAPLLGKYWIQSDQFSTDEITHALMLMGLVVACRWPVGLYMGVLMGLQRVARASIIGATVGTFSNLGAVAILAFVSPTIEAFFLWHAGVGIVNALYMRWLAWRLLDDGKERYLFDWNEIKRIWRFSAGLSGIAITGVILIQLDKILLSKFLSLGDFGRYMVAVAVANGLYILLTPLFNAIYPRMTALVASGNIQELERLYRSGTRLFLAVLFPVAIMAAVFSEDLLYLWTGNRELATSSAMVVSLCLLGTTLNGVMHFPYALQLAYGETRLPFQINIILIIIMIPMTIFLAVTYGPVGGAGAWALLNFIYLLVGTWLTHRHLLIGLGGRWLLGDVMLPLSAALVAGFAGWTIKGYLLPSYADFIAAIGFGGMAFAFIVIVSPGLREYVRNLYMNRKRVSYTKAH